MPGPHPDVAAARLAVRACLADLPPGARVLVACSGGADSLALAAATAFVAARDARPAGAVVVDHRLQPGSDRVAARAAAQCVDLGLEPVLVRAVDVDGGPRGTGAGGPEAAAREARYGALAAAAEEEGAAAVLLGHTLDDQAETVLLGLARGSGARSLAGMSAVRGLWRRPFLGLRRAQTEQVCQALSLDFVRDPANAADGPWRAADGSPLRRAAVRETALPALAAALGPGVVEALGRTAAQLTRDADLLETLADDLLATALRPPAAVTTDVPVTPPDAGSTPTGAPAGDRPTPSAPTRPHTADEFVSLGAHPPPRDTFGSGSDADSRPERVTRREGGDGGEGSEGFGLELDVEVLAAAHPALRSRALRAAAVRAGAAAGALAAVHVAELEALVVGFHGQGPIPLPGGIVAARRCGRLTLGSAG